MKRGQSGLSFVLGIDKPIGMTSHDVVNRVRSIFSEKRVGHAGTLDPAASGVLPVCVGSATKLCSYLGDDRKSYLARIVFGTETATDDAEGQIVNEGGVEPCVDDASFARRMLLRFTGRQRQTPPRYSAIKRNGVKSYEAARKGEAFTLEDREVVVYEANLIAVHDESDDLPVAADGDPAGASSERFVAWDVEFSVSKGTYIRSLARDIGRACHTYAHLGGLRRLSVGSLWLSDCVTLETLSEVRERAAIDPLVLLGVRYAFAEGSLARSVENGAIIGAGMVQLMRPKKPDAGAIGSTCVPDVRKSGELPINGEKIALLVDNKLRALYAYNERRDVFEAVTVFQIGVSRGSRISG